MSYGPVIVASRGSKQAPEVRSQTLNLTFKQRKKRGGKGRKKGGREEKNKSYLCQEVQMLMVGE